MPQMAPIGWLTLFLIFKIFFIMPCTHCVPGYIVFVQDQMYVTQSSSSVSPYKVYMFVISMTSEVDLALSVRPSVCPSVLTNVSQSP